MTGRINFMLNGMPRAVEGVSPTTTVLDWLRGEARACGTKEGCAEGDCGACTVVIGQRHGDGLRYRAINSCIAFLPQLDGKLLLTVEGLADGEVLHPIQEAMVDCDASQCGFCTPGFAMALLAFQLGGEAATPDTIHEALAGNLCRCTGYRPIVAAAERIAATPETRFHDQATAARAALDALPRGEAVRLEHVTQRYFAPTTVEELLALRAQHPDAHLLAGGTDLALLVTKDYRRLDGVISLARVAGLREIDADPGPKDSRWLTVGAACTYTDLLEVLAVLKATSPASLGQLVTRIGSRQIRNVATVCGNLANASPIADMPPALIALDATVVLDSLAGEREIALEEFFLDYRRTALRPDEILVAVRFRFPRRDEMFRTYKISKRWDQDIAAVCAGFRIAQADGIVTEARIAYGGMAATPKRAFHAEQALIGQPWTEATIESAVAGLDRDFAPISDWRASAAYRRRVAGNLLRRFWLESASPDVPLAVMAL